MKDGHEQYGVVNLGGGLNKETAVADVKAEQAKMDPREEASFEVTEDVILLIRKKTR